MQTNHAILSETYRLASLLSDFDAGCDLDFDAEHEELEREFAELRIRFGDR